jgi:dolichol-phosphate mannosyltransferase
MSLRTRRTARASGPAVVRPPLAKVLVLIPTYNERENLPRIVERVRHAVPAVDILVLDDNSPAGTGAVADELAAADGQVKVLHRAGKEGLGAAYLAGFLWGLDQGYDALVEMDADGSHRPEHLPAMLAAAADADVVIGSRWVPGGSVVNWPLHRKALSVGGNQYIRILLGMPVNDATAGYRVYRAGALRAIGLQKVESHGYCFQTDLTWKAVKAGLKVVEVPITFVEREIGDSKMSGDIFKESLVNVTLWGVKYRAGQVASLGKGLGASVGSLAARRSGGSGGSKKDPWHSLDTSDRK